MNSNRSVQQKIDLFRAFFSGLSHVYGTYDLRTGCVRQVKQPVTDAVVLQHLQGKQPYGVYLLDHDRTRAVVADFDASDPGPPKAFLQCAALWQISAYLERSKRNWHIWLFLELPGTNAALARAAVGRILEEIREPATEVFPKHDRLDARNRFGNFIHSPLLGSAVPRGRTVFVDPDNLAPFPDQWEFLAGVRRVPTSQLSTIVMRYPTTAGHEASVPASQVVQRPAKTFGLAPCAQRILAEGVTSHQRVACFRLAVHLKKAGVPLDIAVASLRAWAAKNRPEAGKGILSPNEIDEQAGAAYRKNYLGCGCEDAAIQPFCDRNCPVRRDGWR